jgi:hypothetical protein
MVANLLSTIIQVLVIDIHPSECNINVLSFEKPWTHDWVVLFHKKLLETCK